jgi:predicted metal-binding protein
MNQTNNDHLITVCVDCVDAERQSRPGREILTALAQAVLPDGVPLASRYRLSGMACLAGCARPCTVAFQAADKTQYLFGDLRVEDVAESLAGFAALYRDRPDGMTRSAERPAGLLGKTLARIPPATFSGLQEVRHEL